MNDQSFADYLGTLDPDVEALFKPTVTRSSGEMHEISAGAGVGYFNLIWNLGAGLSHSILGGASTLTGTIADALGDKVQRGAQVHEVVQNAGSVVVRYQQNGVEHEVEARTVILATPAPISHKIAVNLESDMRDALGKIKYGPYVAGAFLTNESERQVWDNSYAIATPKKSFAVALNMSSVVRGAEDHRQPGTSIMVFSPAGNARDLMDRSDEEIRDIYLRELDEFLPNFSSHVVEFEAQRWPLGAPYPRRGFIDYSP